MQLPDKDMTPTPITTSIPRWIKDEMKKEGLSFRHIMIIGWTHHKRLPALQERLTKQERVIRTLQQKVTLLGTQLHRMNGDSND